VGEQEGTLLPSSLRIHQAKADGPSESGKSSTILLLLRLLEPLPACSENITIDGTPLHKIDRSTLRQRIIAVPQDAVFLPDRTSFMSNLDPFGASTESECRAVLETVGLWTLVEQRGGLAQGLSADKVKNSYSAWHVLSSGAEFARAPTRQTLVLRLVVRN
jgi:ABC-type transport system involved in cytochrome bd biosynthesis fused ATPase/permease subunit